MAAPTNLLQYLQAKTVVDCDTLDASVPKSLGPFVDCTSNQAIAYFELQRDAHVDLLKKAAALAKEYLATYPQIPQASLAVEIAMILLALQAYPHLTGNVHIQVNPLDSYSTPKIVEGAKRVVELFNKVEPNFDSSRVCIKIPSTWEGLVACEQLQKSGIKTLATTLFTIEQALLAGEVGCTYIAPYVNELKVHFEAGYRDPSPNFDLCVASQLYYRKHNLHTKVLPASLTSIKECMALAGVDHITIAPKLLAELVETKVDSETTTAFPSLFANKSVESSPPKTSFLSDESAYRLAVTRRNNGREELKLIQAINIFCDMQLQLEQLISAF